jgi:dephospho-CoA kinase
VKRVSVAGGIGAGKTAVTDRLSSLGFSVVDADVIARRVVEKGQPAWSALRDAFGTAVLTPENHIDRKFLADVVFHDASALRRLNSITHGYIAAEIKAELDAASGSVVFVALPLFRPEHREGFGFDEAWAVQADPAIAFRRLTTLRGLDADDALSRLAAQMDNDERATIVDRVLWNDGTLDELYGSLDEALDELMAND